MKNHEYDDFNVGIDRSTEIFTHLTPFFLDATGRGLVIKTLIHHLGVGEGVYEMIHPPDSGSSTSLF
jgi:hypothetical protein